MYIENITAKNVIKGGGFFNINLIFVFKKYFNKKHLKN